MFEDEETLGGLTMAEQGDEEPLDYQNPADVARAIQRSSAEQKAYYDSLAEQLKAKRYGPSRSEQLFALSAAFAAPTRTRGFAGVMGNVMPVFQQFERSKREAEEARAEDMQKLQLARMGASKGELSNALALQRLQAQYNKPKNPYSGAVWDADAKRWVMRPGAEGAPPTLTPEQAAEYAKDPKNRGMKFFTTDGREMEIK
jgi:hypothetical protein